MNSSATVSNPRDSDRNQLINNEDIRYLAFTDWIDSTRDAHPELARRLDRVESAIRELVSIGIGIGDDLREPDIVEKERNVAIASVQEYFSKHQDLVPEMLEIAADCAKWEEREAEMAWIEFQGQTDAETP